MPTNNPLNLRLLRLSTPLLVFAALLATLALIDRSGPAVPSVASLDPPGAERSASLGDTYYQRSRETGNPRFHARSEDAYRAALADEPDNAVALSGLATVALARHDFAGGLRLARRAREAAPGELVSYPALIDGLIETGRYRTAGRALERMVALKPNLAAYSRVSYYRELNGDLEGAARALRLAISAGGGTAEATAFAHSLLGDLEARRGREQAAERAYRGALAVEPGFGAARAGLASLDAGRGRLNSSIRELRGQVGQPPSPDALAELGEVEQAAGRPAAAQRHYAASGRRERALLAQGSKVDAGVTLFEADHGDPSRAVALGRTAWRSSPSVSSADAYSWALYRAGRIDAASRFSAEAMRLGSRDPEFLFHAGMIARRDGRIDDARRLLGTLIDQAPRWNAVYAPRAKRTLAQLG